VFNEAHLRRILGSYAAYYNPVPTHLIPEQKCAGRSNCSAHRANYRGLTPVCDEYGDRLELFNATESARRAAYLAIEHAAVRSRRITQSP
jgi:hypothetical protein